jgi:hypothetical protein
VEAAVGYLFGVKFLYGINGVTGMAVHTLITLCILCLGLLAARPRDGFMGVLSSAGYGDHVARRLTIPTLVLPLLIGYLCVKAEHVGLFGYRDALSILAGLTVMLLGGVVVYTGRSLNRADERRRILEQRLTDLAERDPLTNLYNRRRFEEALEHELIRSARHSTSAALIMFDLDRLKHVNDSFGHAAGDQLLLGVAETLTTQLGVTTSSRASAVTSSRPCYPRQTTTAQNSPPPNCSPQSETAPGRLARRSSPPRSAPASPSPTVAHKTPIPSRARRTRPLPREISRRQPLHHRPRPTPIRRCLGTISTAATPSRTGTSKRAEAQPSNISAPAR